MDRFNRNGSVSYETKLRRKTVSTEENDFSVLPAVTENLTQLSEKYIQLQQKLTANDF